MTIDLQKHLATHGAQKRRSYNGAMMSKGKQGEEVILRWLRDRTDVLEVDDFRADRALQKADVDCGIYSVDGTVMLAEVKTDYHLKEGGNIVFEFLRINHTASPDVAVTLGWTARTPAKLVIFFAPNEGRAYVIPTAQMRLVFQAFTKKLRPERSAWVSNMPTLNMVYVSTDEIKSTLNVCLPWSEFPSKTIHVYDVSEYI